MKILILDDDLKNANTLRNQILDLGEEVMGPFSEIDEVLHNIKNSVPSLILSAFSFGNSNQSGVDIIRTIKRDYNLPLIFIVDAENENEIPLKKAKAALPDYFLNKGASKAQLEVAIDLAFFTFGRKNDNKSTQIQLSDNGPDDFFFIKQNGKYLKIRLENISFLQAAGSQTEIFMTKGRHVVSSNLGDVLKQISHEETLIQCHRSYAVNLLYVSSFDHHTIYIQNKNKIKEIPIGESFKKKVFDQIKILKSK